MVFNKEEGDLPGEMWVRREREEPGRCLGLYCIPTPNPAFLWKAWSLSVAVFRKEGLVLVSVSVH